METITSFFKQAFGPFIDGISNLWSSVKDTFGGMLGGSGGTIANRDTSPPPTSTSTDTGRTVYSGVPSASTPVPAAKESCGWNPLCHLKDMLGGSFRGAARLPDGGEIVKNPNNARINIPGVGGISVNRGRISVGGPNGGISF